MNTTTSTITTTTPTTTTLRPLNTVPPLPDWLADDDSSDFEYLIPGMPGSAQIKNVERNLKKLGAAIYLNSLSSQDLHGQMAGIMQLNDFRQDEIERMGSLLMKKINTTREGMKILATTFGEAYQNISETLDMLSLFKSKIVADLYPQLFGIKMVARDIEFLTDMWTLGVIDLTSGFLPPQIITEEMLLKVIKIIQNEVLKRPAFGNFNLLSRLPGFYYKTKNMVTYTRTKLKLILTLSIPLYQDSGRYPLYKIFSFPIPFTMGTTNDDSKGQYTLIKCGCSLSADHFKINPRLSGCDIGALQDLNRTSKIYTRNTNVVTEFVTNEDINAVKSYAAKINELFPPYLLKKLSTKYKTTFPSTLKLHRNWAKFF